MEKKVSFKISGMHCKACAKRIGDALSGIEGIQNARVDFASEKASFLADTEKVSFGQVKGVISGLGYGVEGSKPAKKHGSSLLPASKSPGKNASGKGLLQGIAFGLVPHIGCIGFIAASVLGATVAVEFFKPFLMNPWFFHILIAISIGFATLSAAFYLRKNGVLSMAGIKRKKKYLATMYGSTIAINLVLFLLIFPLLANADTGSFAAQPAGLAALASGSQAAAGTKSLLRLQVDIPCSGHAPLITGDLKTIEGVTGVKFEFPNYFDIAFDSKKTSKEEILALEVFKTYKASLVSESAGNVPGKVALEGTNSPSAGASGTATASLAGIGETKYFPGTGSEPGYQEINMDVVSGGYSPNAFVLKAGVPVNWVINGKQVTGCNGTIIVPAYNLNIRVTQGEQTINFIPEKAGTIGWSCGMGMIKGQFVVLDDASVDSTGKLAVNAQVQQQIASAPKSGGGCSCGA